MISFLLHTFHIPEKPPEDHDIVGETTQAIFLVIRALRNLHLTAQLCKQQPTQ